MAKTSVVAVRLVMTMAHVFTLQRMRQFVFVKTLRTGHTVKTEPGVLIRGSRLLQSASSTLEKVPETLQPRFAWQDTDLPLWNFTFASKIVEASPGCLNQRQHVVFQSQLQLNRHLSPLVLVLNHSPRETKFPSVTKPRITQNRS